MSIDYYIHEPIPVAELLGGRLDKYGVREAPSPKATNDSKFFTDGQRNYLWSYGDPVDTFVEYVPNRYPGFILQSIATEFGIEIYSEYDFKEGAKPSYIPGEKPTPEEIARLREDWRIECEALDREIEIERERLWGQKREATG
jgi:hypothetical protein